MWQELGHLFTSNAVFIFQLPFKTQEQTETQRIQSSSFQVSEGLFI